MKKETAEKLVDLMIKERMLNENDYTRASAIDTLTRNFSEPYPCSGCEHDLTLPYAVKRKYTNKDNGEILCAGGHYNVNGEFIADVIPDLSQGRYDLHDGSDICAICGEIVG